MTAQKMAGYKLYYFPARGRAEMCRLSFAAANIEFEDIRLDREEWAKEKPCRLRGSIFTQFQRFGVFAKYSAKKHQGTLC